ncbi:uncharacterized protein LOC110844571 isoform X2 [Folsomia candida]|uniref:uncharacterized protein LOC110844571 isoform X2 n=1 Tax=Folsomia candida TaxID=158441 RepID=UPI000B8EFE5C|nr:uncharacterized protein LOC110844571 isoform X2 [Folsomia candida]
MQDAVFETVPRTENLPITQTIARRRASLNPIMLSRSAPDALNLAQLIPLRRTSRSSLPISPSCSVATQTPTDVKMHFQFPESFEFDIDSIDGISLRSDSRRGSNTSSSGSDREDFLSLTSPSLPPQDLNIWSRCLRRLSSHSDILHGIGVNRRFSFTEQRVEMKVEVQEVQDVGQQLRSIGDDFERSRLTRTRSMSFVSQKKR